MEKEIKPTYTLRLQLLKLERDGNLTKEAIKLRESIEAELKIRKEERENDILKQFKRVAIKNKPAFVLELEMERLVVTTKKDITKLEIIKKELELRKQQDSDFFNDL